jgi:hypothetical protein
VAYLVAVDRRQKDFLVVESENRTAAWHGAKNIRRISSARSLPGLVCLQRRIGAQRHGRAQPATVEARTSILGHSCPQVISRSCPRCSLRHHDTPPAPLSRSATIPGT